MEIALTVKNNSKVFKPDTNNVIIYDGKMWYVTTKDALFKEYQDKVDAELAKFESLITENAQFKAEVAKQMIDMSEIIKKYITSKE